jgi:hypothetical protein
MFDLAEKKKGAPGHGWKVGLAVLTSRKLRRESLTLNKSLSRGETTLTIETELLPVVVRLCVCVLTIT